MSWGLGRREKKKKDCPPVQFCAQSVQSGLLESRMAQGLGSEAQRRLFEQIRQAVPLVDAAIGKIIRLVGDFELECSNRQAQEELRRWCSQVPVGAGGSGLRQFLHSYLDDLLTYGNAVGEMVPFCEGEGIAGAVQCAAGKHPDSAGGESAGCEAVCQQPDGGGGGACPSRAGAVHSAESKGRERAGQVAAGGAAVCFLGAAEHLSGNRAEL